MNHSREGFKPEIHQHTLMTTFGQARDVFAVAQGMLADLGQGRVRLRMQAVRDHQAPKGDSAPVRLSYSTLNPRVILRFESLVGSLRSERGLDQRLRPAAVRRQPPGTR